MFRSLFVLFLLVPLIEIYFLIKVGYMIGAGWTVFAVVGTAVLGASLLRIQGISTLQRAQVSMAQGEIPALAMLEAVALAFSGILLLTPGFVTDTLGFILLIPVVRQSLIKRVLKNSQFFYRGHTTRTHNGYSQSSIIEGEIVNEDLDKSLK
tara:strand:+ start:2146 stop:2601 length:456 start_codon:yes stop_codon:yes gene_type:complete